MSLKFYPKSFVNPLLALAFKEGIDFVEDPDYKASQPKHEGDKWVVLVEHDDNDDDDDVIMHSTVSVSKAVPDKKRTLHNYEDRLKNMKPLTAKPAPTEIIHAPVKITGNDPNFVADEPCGECLPCSQGQDCLRAINAACLAMTGRER